MLKKTARYAWKILPPKLRLRIVRVTQPKFTASAAAVVVNENREVLLLNHVLRPFAIWGLPGGFIKAGEQPDEALTREVREETGLEIYNTRQILIRTIGRHIEILFAANANGAGAVGSREIIELGWFRRDALPQDLSTGQRHLIEKVLNSEI